MKRCSYCGAEYPDDATECAVDKTPFEEAPLEPAAPVRAPRFGIFAEDKIPISLGIVSYFYFLPGACLLAFCPFMILLGSFLAFFGSLDGATTNGSIILACFTGGLAAILVILLLCIFPITMILAYIACAIFAVAGSHGFAEGSEAIVGGAIALSSVYLSRGLRGYSRGWRTCALVLIWFWFSIIAFTIVRYLITHKLPEHTTTIDCVIGYGVTLLVLIWQYRVLTRPDIRELFGV